MESALTITSSLSNGLNDMSYYVVLVTFIGIVILAPLSLPIIVIVLVKVLLDDPYKVLIVVPVKLIDVPITVLDTLVPSVVAAFNLSASAVFIPTPVKLESNLTSAIVTVYPLDSKACEVPKKFKVWGVIVKAAPCCRVIDAYPACMIGSLGVPLG